jgi:hypothetical protein
MIGNSATRSSGFRLRHEENDDVAQNHSGTGARDGHHHRCTSFYWNVLRTVDRWVGLPTRPWVGQPVLGSCANHLARSKQSEPPLRVESAKDIVSGCFASFREGCRQQAHVENNLRPHNTLLLFGAGFFIADVSLSLLFWLHSGLARQRGPFRDHGRDIGGEFPLSTQVVAARTAASNLSTNSCSSSALRSLTAENSKPCALQRRMLNPCIVSFVSR